MTGHWRIVELEAALKERDAALVVAQAALSELLACSIEDCGEKCPLYPNCDCPQCMSTAALKRIKEVLG